MTLTSAQLQALRNIADCKITMRNCGVGAWRIWGPAIRALSGA